MKCTEFRDLSELLADGALAGPEAAAARAHRESCGDCRSFEAACAVLLEPLHGFPPGPYLPPARPGLPPWASGPVLGLLLAFLGTAGAWAWRGRPEGTVPVPRGPETARAERTERAPAKPSPAEPVPPAIADDGVELSGRVISFPARAPVPGTVVAVEGLPPATTDATGVFRLRGIAPALVHRLQVTPPGRPTSEALLPYLGSGQVHTLDDLIVGEPCTVTVKVVRFDALPGAGVRVRACRLAPTAFPDDHPTWTPGPGFHAVPAHRSATADAEGCAEFPDLPPGTWTFQAEIDGVPFSLPAELAIRDELEMSATLLLDRTTAFAGRVLDDATGAPVAGAQVRWSRMGVLGPNLDVRRHGAAVTGADGGFGFAAAPAGPLLLEVVRPGTQGLSGCMGVDASRIDRADLRLPATGVLAGVCVEKETGLPAAGAIVRIIVRLSDGMAQAAKNFVVRTGPDGRFEARGLPETAVLQASLHPESAWFDPGLLVGTILRTGMPVRIEGIRTFPIEGRVLDGEGRPAPGRPVLALAVRPGGDGFAGFLVKAALGHTDLEGNFRLENLPPGRNYLVAPDPAEVDSLRLDAEARNALDSAEPPSCVVDLPAPPGPGPVLKTRAPDFSGADPGSNRNSFQVRGRVLDLAGAPAPGTNLIVMRGDLTPFLRDRATNFVLWAPLGESVPVAADGSFVADATAADAVTLVATSPRHPPSALAVRQEGRETVEGVLLTLEEGRSLSGRILREDGTPAAGALLEATPLENPRLEATLFMVRGRTAEDGSFRIEGLFPGPHTLTVGRGPGPVHHVPGVLPGGPSVEVRLPAGDGVRPPLPPMAPRWKDAREAELTETLDGRILGRLGIGTSIAAFEPAFPSRRTYSSTVDEAGRFACKVPPMRRFSLAAHGRDGRWAFADELPFRARDAVLRFGGPSTGLLRGRAVTAAGAPAAHVPVHAVRIREEGEADLPALVLLEAREWSFDPVFGEFVPRVVRTTVTGTDGSFDLGSPRGRWAVFAGAPGSDAAASGAPVAWSAADPRYLEIPLAPGRVLRVAAGETEVPPAAAEVRLDSFLPGTSGPVLGIRLPRPSDGVFVFRGLPPGPCTILLLDVNRKEIGRAAAEPGEERDPVVSVPVRR